MDSVRFLLDLAVLLFTAKAFGIAAKKLGAPEVVGQIAAGLLLGPAVLGWVTETDFLAQMAEIGVMMLMFEAGLETDLQKMRKTGLKATIIAFAGVVVPIVSGMLLFMAFYGFGGPGEQEEWEANWKVDEAARAEEAAELWMQKYEKYLENIFESLSALAFFDEVYYAEKRLPD